MNKNAYSTIDLSACRNAQMGIKMKRKKMTLLLWMTVGILLLFAGCGNSQPEPEAEAAVIEESAETVTEEAAETEAEEPAAETASISTEVAELYQSQKLMLEMLVNENCVIEDTGDSISVSSPDGMAYVGVSFVPGIQNLGETATLIPQILEANNAVSEEIMDGVLFGARAKHCVYSMEDEEGNPVQGIFATAIINSSLYMMDVAFAPECTDEDASLIVNVFSSMNVLTPTSVDAQAKTAVYQTKYPDAAPAKAAEKTYVPVVEWVYPPYYYYSWYSDYDYPMYDSAFYEPDWDYYLDGGWWSWDWDDEDYWGFYDEYGDWYSEDYYDYYDYYYDYDPYSDPGDYYDYYYDYDPYSDPGDYYDYDPYSDPGDYYDYDSYSDPGDYYDDYDYSYDDYDY